MPTIDLNADIGESFGPHVMGQDELLLPTLTSANVACGFHAGDPRTMERTVRLCREAGVAIGAHPGFPDLVGFGRRAIEMSREEVRADVLYQLGALDAFVRAAGGRLEHVSPHGRLGNLTVTDETYAAGVLDAVEAFDPAVVVLGQPGVVHELARERGLRSGRLGFPDRAYEADGALVSRREPDALVHDPAEVAQRAVAMVTDGTVTSRAETPVAVEVDAILLHGDSPGAVDAARLVRQALEQAGVTIGARGR